MQAGLQEKLRRCLEQAKELDEAVAEKLASESH
jgi:hypothetical protein